MMKRMVLVLLAATMLIPVAAAQDSGAEEQSSEGFKPDFNSMIQGVESFGQLNVRVTGTVITFSWSDIVIGAEFSQWVRQTYDEKVGNDDGTIDADERQAAETAIAWLVESEFGKYAHKQGFQGYFLIDETNPTEAVVSYFDSSGIEGAVDSEDPITVSFDLAVEFETFTSDVHTVKLDMGKYRFKAVSDEKAAAVVEDFTITVIGADGWSVDGASVQPGCAAENFVEESSSLVFDAADVDCFTGHGGVLLVFSVVQTQVEGSGSFMGMPGFELPFLIAALVGAVVVLRRRA